MRTHHSTLGKSRENKSDADGKENPVNQIDTTTEGRQEYGWKFRMTRSSEELKKVLETMEHYRSETFEIGHSHIETLIVSQEEVRQFAVLHRLIEHYGDFEVAKEHWLDRMRSTLLENSLRSSSTNVMANAINELKREAISRLYRTFAAQ